MMDGFLLLGGSPARSQTQDDREQDRVGQDAAGQRHACQGRCTEPQRVRVRAVTLGAGLVAGLSGRCFPFSEATLWRFLKIGDLQHQAPAQVL